jgi:hypothetical protein
MDGLQDRRTSMPFGIAEHELAVEPNCVYLD